MTRASSPNQAHPDTHIHTLSLSLSLSLVFQVLRLREEYVAVAADFEALHDTIRTSQETERKLGDRLQHLMAVVKELTVEADEHAEVCIHCTLNLPCRASQCPHLWPSVCTWISVRPSLSLSLSFTHSLSLTLCLSVCLSLACPTSLTFTFLTLTSTPTPSFHRANCTCATSRCCTLTGLPTASSCWSSSSRSTAAARDSSAPAQTLHATKTPTLRAMAMLALMLRAMLMLMRRRQTLRTSCRSELCARSCIVSMC